MARDGGRRGQVRSRGRQIARRVTILGTDRRGFAVASDGSPNVLLLHPRGHVLPIRNADPVHVTVRPAARAATLGALSSGDEARADAALVVVLESEIALYALLDLTLLLAGRTGNAIAHDLRASFAEQLFKMATRRAPWLEEDSPAYRQPRGGA